MDTEKIIDIETTLAHHEQQIAEMSTIITDQWREIEALKRKLSRTLDKIDQLAHDTKRDGEELSTLEQAARDKPPHY